MTKSSVDHEHGNSNGRVRSYVNQERESGVHPAISELHRRPHSRDEDDSRKKKEYTRIERGEET